MTGGAGVIKRVDTCPPRLGATSSAISYIEQALNSSGLKSNDVHPVPIRIYIRSDQGMTTPKGSVAPWNTCSRHDMNRHNIRACLVRTT